MADDDQNPEAPSPDPDADEPDLAGDADLACWQEAIRIRAQRPRWVITWLPDEREYHAYPLFKAPRGTCLTAQQPAELGAAIDEFEVAVLKQPDRRPGSGTADGSSAQEPGGT